MRRVIYEIQSLSKNGEIIKDVVSLEDGFFIPKDGTPPLVFLEYTLKNGKTIHVDGWNWESKINPLRFLIYSDKDIYTIHLVEKEFKNDRL